METHFLTCKQIVINPKKIEPEHPQAIKLIIDKTLFSLVWYGKSAISKLLSKLLKVPFSAAGYK